MSEEKPRIGGIGQQRSRYGTIGGRKSQDQTLERPNVQEAEHSGAEKPKRPDSQVLEHPDPRAPKRERHTIYLPPELSEWVRVRAAKTRREISELATEALERYKSEIESS